ncbi:MAG: FadR family transcriptional regulator [Caldilineaceae bacterium]|nr:FadR family transcriptional regulator [Caldilineaceae bacterium]MCB9137547.1 FadR family transcriptional regulator [Caldilineaceae bacterium]
MTTPQRQRTPAVAEEVRSFIKEYILTNRLPPGTQLPPEGYWMEELSVGRSSVREAVKALQSLGIVEIHRGNGLYVRQVNFDPILELLSYAMRFDPQMFANVFQIRIWLESAVIKTVVAQLSEEEIQELEALLQEWERRLAANESHVDLDETFHAILYRSLGNPTLNGLLQVFWLAFRTFDDDAIRQTNLTLALRQHQEIMAAVRARDAERSHRLLMEHFNEIQERIHQLIAEGQLV